MKLSRKLLLPATALALMSATPAHSVIPIADVPVLIENITANLQDLNHWNEERGLNMAAMDAEAMNTSMMVDSNTNLMANNIERQNQNRADLHNKRVEEMSAPDSDAGRTLAITAGFTQTLCSANDEAYSRNLADLYKHTGFHEDVDSQVESQREIASNLVQSCEQMASDGVSSDEPFRASMCLQAGILTGGTTLDSYSQEEQEAVDNIIDIISGPLPSIKRTGAMSGVDNAHNEQLLAEMRREAMRALVTTSLNEIASMRKVPGGMHEEGALSPLDMLSTFASDRFGNQDWLADIANVGEEEVMPSQVLRKIAVMESFQVHMSVLQFKQSLRMESLSAASLSLQAEPLE